MIILIHQDFNASQTKLFDQIHLSASTFMKGISDRVKNDLLLIKNKFGNFLNEINIYNHTHKKNNFIFWCWLQGLKKTPLLYKSTLKSIYRYCKQYKIIIIDENNMFKYIKLPSYIYEKYKNKMILKAHFCDLIRLELLIKYGGTWIDASVLITHYNEIFFSQDLFFFKNNFNNSISGSNWFITSEIASPVLKTTRDLLYEYWRKYNYAINYLIFHIFFTMALDRYKSEYKNSPNYYFIPALFLYTQLLNRYDKQKYDFILNSSEIHKTTIKKGYGNKNSFIRYIIQNYKIA